MSKITPHEDTKERILGKNPIQERQEVAIKGFFFFFFLINNLKNNICLLGRFQVWTTGRIARVDTMMKIYITGGKK